MNKKKIAIISGCTALFLGAVTISPTEEVEKEDNNYIQSTETLENTEEIIDNEPKINDNNEEIVNENQNSKETETTKPTNTDKNKEKNSSNNTEKTTDTQTENEKTVDSERLPLKAICNDGTISYQDDITKDNYRGMCSHHGGIKEKLGRQK